MGGKMVSINKTQKEKFYNLGYKLPKCVNIGCNNDVAVRNWGNWSLKSECSSCQTARKNGKIKKNIIIHKKSYCENIDGHLGFKCPVIDWKGFESGLDLDHVDGNHLNNSPENVKTYCKLCHGRKSLENGDCSNKKISARIFDK
jgi:hypothetical protein